MWITLHNHSFFIYYSHYYSGRTEKPMQRAEINELVTKAKKLLITEVTPISYNTWIRDLYVEDISGNTVTILTQNNMQKDMLEARYVPVIQNTFIFLTNIDYHVVVESEEERALAGIPTHTHQPQTASYSNSNLKPEYTFDSFVIGDNNRFAAAAALAVSEAPATAYNPLFLYGGPGLGKTHLMHAIGNEILKRNKEYKILYVTCEKFGNQFINAIQENKNEMFRNKYRNIDVLLIDDIQFIEGKDRTQEEFFHTFNTLHEAGKQIIITCDRPPKDLPLLQERLRTRFEWGLMVDISKPDYETRMAILKKKAQLDNIIIDDEVLSNIATKVDTNIRNLEGILKKIVAMTSLGNSPITIELSDKAISDVISNENKVLSAEYIQNIVAKYFNITVEDLKGSRRSTDITFPRQIAMYLCRDVAQISTPKIGQAFGKRDHSTVMHACNKIAKETKENSNTKLIVETVKKSLFET